MNCVCSQCACCLPAFSPSLSLFLPLSPSLSPSAKTMANESVCCVLRQLCELTSMGSTEKKSIAKHSQASTLDGKSSGNSSGSVYDCDCCCYKHLWQQYLLYHVFAGRNLLPCIVVQFTRSKSHRFMQRQAASLAQCEILRIRRCCTG